MGNQPVHAMHHHRVGSLLLSGGEAGTGALTDHVALELGECGKDVKREMVFDHVVHRFTPCLGL